MTPKDRKELKKFLWDYGDKDLLETLEAAGLAIVPVEPTEDMLEAGYLHVLDPNKNRLRPAYRLMLATGPFKEKEQ